MEDALFMNKNFQRIKSTAVNRIGKYGIILVCAKVVRCIGLFECYDLLKYINILYFLFFIKASSGLVFTLLQKPFSRGSKLTKGQWIRITRHAFLGILVNVLWLLGLTLCGPLSEVVIVSMLSGIFTSTKNHSRTRGSLFFLIAIVCLLAFDSDDAIQRMNEHPEGKHSSALQHMFYWFISAVGVADHKGGILLLVGALLMKVAYSVIGKKLAVDIGGEKRLHALSCLVSAVIISPAVVVLFFTSSSSSEASSYMFTFIIVIFFVFIANFYVESYAAQRYDIPQFSRISYIAISTFAFVLAYFWQHPAAVAVSQIHGKYMEARTSEHVISGASTVLSRPSGKGSTGSFIGYSPDGLPLYNFAENALQRATEFNLTAHVQHFLQTVLKERDSRHLFYFLCINLIFAFVELFYGFWSNSLGLISDSFHMLFDCMALVMGLVASVMAKWKPTRVFSYGYGRVEILSGFVNSLFLLVVAAFLLMEAFHRLFDPPRINTERLLLVSVGGLIVNLVGVLLFTHNHSHSHGHSHGHSQSHGHGNHNHENKQSCDHHHDHGNANIKGVYLHVLADLMGSIGVIISSILIAQYGLYVSDPICTLLIAVLILCSLWPLLKDSVRVLILRLPTEIEKELHHALSKVQNVPGVLSFRSYHFWKHSEKDVVGVITLQVEPHAIEQRIITQVTPILKEGGITQVTVQVEKEDFYQHMSGLSANSEEILRMTKKSQTVYHPENYEVDDTEDEYAKLI